jgi:hypothetical protein
MGRSVRGRLLALVMLLAVAVAFPAASSSAKKPRFKVVSARATAKLTYRLETTTSVSNGTVDLLATRRKVGRGFLPGRLLFPIKGSVKETAQIKQLIPGTPEYQELNCGKTRKVKGRGGVTLTRVGTDVEVRWAFPQAKATFCQGPTLDKTVTDEMKKTFPAAQFKKKKVTVVLEGENTFKSARLSFTYTWQATLRLSRV